MTDVTVANRGHNPIEAAGRVFPPRSSTSCALDDRQIAAVRANRRLDVTVSTGDLDGLTVAQLREVASQRDVDLSGATTKADILSRLTGS